MGMQRFASETLDSPNFEVQRRRLAIKSRLLLAGISKQRSSNHCVRSVQKSNVFMPLDIALSEKQIPRFVGNVSS